MATKSYGRITASGAVCASRGRLSGFYVANTTTGTLVLYDGASTSGAQITGTITPSIGWNALPIDFQVGLYASIGGSALDVTFALE